MADKRPKVQTLFQNLKNALPELEKLLEECSNHWGYEDPIYRFYHQSFKVYGLQNTTGKIVLALQALLSEESLNKWFMQVFEEGVHKGFELEHNKRWLKETRPILEAFFHARYFLEMAVKYGKELEEPPQMLPSGWAAFLYLYNLR